jgi:hypothetical protein
MKGKFKEIISKFPGWLDVLQKSPSLSRDQSQSVPDHGIYVFYDEKDQPLTFAFILAKEKLVNPAAGTKSRKALQSDEEFSKKYLETKINVSKMRVRVVEIIESTEQALFEYMQLLN